MEESGYFPSTLPSLSATQRSAESSYIRVSNTQQHSQMSATQFANSIGQGTIGPPISTRSDVDAGCSVESQGVGLVVPFQQNGTLKPDLVLNSLPQPSPSQDTTEDNPQSTSANPRFLQTSGNSRMTAADLSESLHKIEHLVLNTSLSLDACCSPESKRANGTQLSTTPNLAAAVSCLNSSADNFSGINVPQQPSTLR